MNPPANIGDMGSIREDPTCLGATKPVGRKGLCSRAQELQPPKPACLEAAMMLLIVIISDLSILPVLEWQQVNKNKKHNIKWQGK